MTLSFEALNVEIHAPLAVNARCGASGLLRVITNNSSFSASIPVCHVVASSESPVPCLNVILLWDAGDLMHGLVFSFWRMLNSNLSLICI